MQITPYLPEILGPVFIPGYLALNIDTDIQLTSAETLGEGGTASILKGALRKPELIAKHGSIPLAVKILRQNPSNSMDGSKSGSSQSEDPELKNSFLYEVAIMASLPANIPYLIKFIGFSENPMVIVMKYYPFSLKNLMTLEGFETSPILSNKIAHDIAAGMFHLHSNGILHLDLKPRKSEIGNIISVFLLFKFRF